MDHAGTVNPPLGEATAPVRSSRPRLGQRSGHQCSRCQQAGQRLWLRSDNARRLPRSAFSYGQETAPFPVPPGFLSPQPSIGVWVGLEVGVGGVGITSVGTMKLTEVGAYRAGTNASGPFLLEGQVL
jgi:hypothetical protein